MSNDKHWTKEDQERAKAEIDDYEILPLDLVNQSRLLPEVLRLRAALEAVNETNYDWNEVSSIVDTALDGWE